MRETITEREAIAVRILSLVKSGDMDGEDVAAALRAEGHDEQHVLWTVWRLIDENRLQPTAPDGILKALP